MGAFRNALVSVEQHQLALEQTWQRCVNSYAAQNICYVTSLEDGVDKDFELHSDSVGKVSIRDYQWMPLVTPKVTN